MQIGLDIGGTKCAVVSGEGGKVFKKTVFPTKTPGETLPALWRAAKEMGRAEAIGISCGGPLDVKDGKLLAPPNLAGWEGLPLAAMAEEALGAPARLCNDANACALAEWRYGAGKGSRNMIFLTFGTGLGAGLILDGRLYEGKSGNAGEAGHIRLAAAGLFHYGKTGTFESFCSGGGIAAQGRALAARRLTAGTPCAFGENEEQITSLTAKELAAYAAGGDRDAKALFGKSGRKLGEGLAILIDLLEPELIVIGGVFARAEALFRPAMERALLREALPEALSGVRILPAALGDAVGDIAALVLSESIIRGEEK